ncbi:MAG: bifunctional oligoribonuclease/PAP phosphatase NrnA [Tissierellia bacterium]|nr:bifunctional oligoribonuclease/PAP phosphatase NrnA [Tissierellia bacterium]
MTDQFKKEIDSALELINSYNNIYICSHIQPDGDSLGSIMALAMAIKKLKNKANINVIKVDDIPSVFDFLPNIDIIKEQDLSQEVELFIALDSSDKERLGIGAEFLCKAKAVINIDHHITNENFGDVNIVLPSSGSTCEIVYKLIKYMGIEMDKDIATCLYTGINTDTGRFMYSNTTYETHIIAAELIKTGIDTSDINISIYQNRTIERTRLLLESLNQLELYEDGKIGLVVVTQDMLEKTGAGMEDTEGIISFVMDINTIEAACLLKEVSNKEIKVSLRSKKYVNVSKIATKFGGGGHVRAAGFTIIGEQIDTAKEMILKEIFKNIR